LLERLVLAVQEGERRLPERRRQEKSWAEVTHKFLPWAGKPARARSCGHCAMRDALL
jgi:hypothetical protein